MEVRDRIYRSNLRGLRKCKSCGLYIGNRVKGCSNKLCTLFLGKPKSKHSVDPVQLVSYRETKIYSVQIKQKGDSQRSFVQITDITLSSDQDGSIVSRNAICFGDTCKYDSKDISISCKHVKSTSECCTLADELKVSKEVLYSMRVSHELKRSLWELYSTNERIIPAVQRINMSTFAIECSPSLAFPAGRLHLNVAPDNEKNFSYMCACKKLKILLSPNNSVEIESDVCDHLLLFLAAVLSSQQLQEQFQNLMNALCSYWVKKNAFKFDSDFLATEDFISFSENILNSVVTYKYNPEDSLTENNLLHNDPSLTFEDIAVKSEGEIVTMSFPGEESSNQYTECLELADCQIELMDQFKLTNQIDLCNNEIQLCEDELFEDNTIPCNMNAGSEAITVGDISTPPFPNQIKPKSRKRRKYAKHKKAIILQDEEGCLSPPLLEFNSWLTFVIEEINLSFGCDSNETLIKHTFKIKNQFFSYLSERFALGEKRRIPNSTVVIADGKHKGLTKLTWIFTTIDSIRRIFCSNELSIEIERFFVQKTPGNFVLYHSDMSESQVKSHQKERKILPTMYAAFINLTNKESDHQRRGFVIEWIPNALPKSKFGILNLEFSIGFKKNNKKIEELPTAVS